MSDATDAVEHPHARLVREMFAAFRSGDVARVEAAIAEDAVWSFPGRAGRLAGRHEGRAAILRFLVQVMQLTSGSFHLEMEDVVGGPRHAVALFRGRATREGRTLDNPTALVVRIENGRAVEMREFVWDLEHVERFWA